MKTARLFIILLNFALVATLVLAGAGLYTKFFGSNFFKEDDIPDWNAKDALPKKPVRPTDTYDKYRPLEELAKRPSEPPPVEEPVEPQTPQLQVEVRSVVFDRNNPAKSGAHIIARGVPRYFSVGDDQLIAQDMPYRLKEIKEDKPELEYTLVFADEKGQVREAKYRRK